MRPSRGSHSLDGDYSSGQAFCGCLKFCPSLRPRVFALQPLPSTQIEKTETVVEMPS